MTKLPFFLLITALSMAGCHNALSQNTDTHAMLHPDSTTIYLGLAGDTITGKDFGNFLKTGAYSFTPRIESGRVVDIRLTKAARTIAAGSMAPDFSITDLEGNTYSLKALKGKTIVLNFWFTSCAPCREEIPELNQLAERYKDNSSVIFLAVTYDSPEKVKGFLCKNPFKFRIAAGQQSMIDQYGVTAYPTSLIIDETGNIAFLLATYDGTNVAQLNGVLQALKK